MVVSQNPTQILQTVFGYDSFRHNQQEIVEHVLAGKDQYCPNANRWR